MREILTNLLDAAGLLLIASGVAAWLSEWLGWAALMVAGVIVLGGSAVATWQSRPPRRRQAKL